MIRSVRARPWSAVLAVLALAAAGLVAAAQPSSAASISEPYADPFFVPPVGYETKAPGTILRTRSVTVTAIGVPVPVRSSQILVRSTDAKGRPAAVVSTVMVPYAPYLGTRPVLSYQPATDSLGDQCNPSYTLRTGLEKEFGVLASGLLKGWAVVVTDYQGPRNAFGAGRMAGHAVLDAVRGATRLPGSGLSPSAPVGLWGYSGGGLATGWAAQLQPTYAPDVNVRGVAAGGTPADLEAAARQNDGAISAGLTLAAAIGLSREYPEITAVLNDEGRQLASDIGDMCLPELVLTQPFRRLDEFTTPSEPLADPVVKQVLDLNRMGAAAPTAPVFLYHSVFDELIPYRIAQTLRSDWCSKGAKVQFHTDYASEHITLELSASASAVSYLDARFRGVKAPTNC